jgi:hypothetical protein
MTKVVRAANKTDDKDITRSRGVAAHGFIGFTVEVLI